MSVGALVERVGEVLGRGHALFGEPPASGGTAARDSGSGLATAGDLVRTGTQRISGLSGALPTGYTQFATDAGPALDAAADADTNLSRNLRDSAEADRSGRQSSGTVVNGAASDTAALAPSTRTAAGQRALITALRGRLAQQQHVIAAYEARSAAWRRWCVHCVMGKAVLVAGCRWAPCRLAGWAGAAPAVAGCRWVRYRGWALR